MMEAALDGMRYVRALYPEADPIVAGRLRESYEYAQIYSYVDVGELDGFTRDYRQTPLIDLERTEAEVFAAFKKNTRYEIRRALATGELEIRSDDPDGEGSYAFYADTKRTDGVDPDLAVEFDQCRIMNAYVNGELSVTSSWYDSGEVLRLKHLASRRKQEGTDHRLIGHATRLLVWTACQTGITDHRTYVDLGGINQEDESKAGVARFKKSFGPEIVTVTYYRSCSVAFTASIEAAHNRGYSVL